MQGSDAASSTATTNVSGPAAVRLRRFLFGRLVETTYHDTVGEAIETYVHHVTLRPRLVGFVDGGQLLDGDTGTTFVRFDESPRLRITDQAMLAVAS